MILYSVTQLLIDCLQCWVLHDRRWPCESWKPNLAKVNVVISAFVRSFAVSYSSSGVVKLLTSQSVWLTWMLSLNNYHGRSCLLALSRRILIFVAQLMAPSAAALVVLCQMVKNWPWSLASNFVQPTLGLVTVSSRNDLDNWTGPLVLFLNADCTSDKQHQLSVCAFCSALGMK